MSKEMENCLQGLQEMLNEEKAKAKSVLDGIYERIDKASKKTELINNLVYERTLITNDVLKMIKEDLSYSSYNLFMGIVDSGLHGCWVYYNYKGTYEDKEKEKEDEQSFNFVFNRVKKHLLGIDNLKLTDVLMYANQWGYQFHFIYNKNKFFVFVPNFASANADNFVYLLQGYRVFRKKDDCFEEIVADIDYANIEPKFKAWLRKEKAKNA